MRTRSSHLFVLGALSLVLVYPGYGAAAERQRGTRTRTPARITATDLGTVNGNITVAVAINNAGAVAGFFQSSEGGDAFYWSRNTGFVVLPGTEEAYDINNRGQVVGSTVVDDMWHGFVWDAKTGAMQDLGPYIPTAINDHGQMIGWSYDVTNNRILAWVYVDNEFRFLFTGETFDGTVVDINNRGVVIGSAYTVAGSRAFEWSKQDGFRFMPPEGGFAHSAAIGINNAGIVYGFLFMGGEEDDPLYPILWSADGSVLSQSATPAFYLFGHPKLNTRLWTIRNANELWMGEYGPILLPPPPGLVTPQVTGVNDRGQVVGMASSQDGVPHAVVWTVKVPNAAHSDSRESR